MEATTKDVEKATRKPDEMSDTSQQANLQDDNLSDMKTAEVLDPFGNEEDAEVQCTWRQLLFSYTNS